MSIDATIATTPLHVAATVGNSSTLTGQVLDLRELSVQGNLTLNYILTGAGTLTLNVLQSNIGFDKTSASGFAQLTGLDTTNLVGITAGTGMVQIDTAVSRFMRIDPQETAGGGALGLTLTLASQ